MPRACAACDREGSTEPSELVPIIGMVCRDCADKLDRCDNEETSILAKCICTIRLFEATRQSLREEARELCKRD